MKPLAIGTRLLLGSVLSVLFGLALAAPPFPPNVGQVTNDTSGVGCPRTNTETYFDMPGLTLTLETRGNPVMVSFTAHVDHAQVAIVQMRPVIDGTPPDSLFVQHNNGANSGTVSILSMLRVYPLKAGTHTFGVQFNCPGDTGSSRSRRWLTVYELVGAPNNRDNDVMKSPFGRM